MKTLIGVVLLAVLTMPAVGQTRPKSVVTAEVKEAPVPVAEGKVVFMGPPLNDPNKTLWRTYDAAGFKASKAAVKRIKNKETE